MRRLFTDEEEQYMRDNYETMSYPDIAKILGFEERQVRGWLNGRGLKKRSRVTDEELVSLIWKHYLNGWPAKRIAEEHSDDLTEKQVQDAACRLGFKKAKKYSVSDDVFIGALSRDEAYILGYLYADGSIQGRKYKDTDNYRSMLLEVVCKSEDVELLESTKRVLGADAPTKDKVVRMEFANGDESRVYKRLVINSTVLSKRLIALGCTIKKTDELYPPLEKHIHSELIYDFIRGYMDGDGCVYLSQSKNDKGWTATTAVVNFVGTKEMLDWIQLKLGTEYKIREKGNAYQVNLTSHRTFVMIYDHLYYPNCLCLERKKKVFVDGIQTIRKLDSWKEKK